ncbi:hypothetical protein D7V95_14035 [bacterium J10(2018)]|nr:hypothetical protein D7V95_14035 [bacterium J10(2018)]
MIINYMRQIQRWIISLAPLISYSIMGILHKAISALIPLADSQSSLYNAKLAIIQHNCNAIIVNRTYRVKTQMFSLNAPLLKR